MDFSITFNQYNMGTKHPSPFYMPLKNCDEKPVLSKQDLTIVKYRIQKREEKRSRMKGNRVLCACNCSDSKKGLK